MAKTLTKAQLAAEIEVLRVARQHDLDALAAELRANEDLKRQLAAALHQLDVQRTAGTKGPRPAPALSAYRETLARARALAMSTGRCVCVGDVR